MNKEEVSKLAREACDQAPREDWNSTAWVFGDETLERFAALVAAAERKPLTDEEIEQAYRHIYHNVPDGSYRTTYYWIEQGIRYAEQAHGIKGDA